MPALTTDDVPVLDLSQDIDEIAKVGLHIVLVAYAA
jgi:hypothetical protein